MKRKTWLTIPLLLTLVVLSQSLTTPLSAVEWPAIYIYPDTVGPDGYEIDTEFNISICTNYTGSDIWGWTLTLTWNPLVLNGTKVVNGDLIKEDDTLIFDEGEFNNIEGKLSLTSAAALNMTTYPYVPLNSTGPGILANVTFTVVGYGDTLITLGIETKLIGYDSSEEKFYDIVDARLMPYNIGHGYFRNTDYVPVHDVAVLPGAVNDTSLYVGRCVSINVTVKNNGTVTERLDVSIYWRFKSPNWLVYNKTVTLDAAETKNLTDIFWNTTNWFPGTGNLTVVVTEVWNETETDPDNNKLVIAEVHLRILGDINEDGDVDSKDYMLLIGVYPDLVPPPANPEADLDGDGDIDSDDWMLLVGNLGKSE